MELGVIPEKRTRKAVDRYSIEDVVLIKRKKTIPSKTSISHFNSQYYTKLSHRDSKVDPNISFSSIVTLSQRDKAPQLILSDDCLECTGCQGGYRMIRATNGVHGGAYYYECEILEAESDNAHVRIGWSTRQGELQAPVGYDKFSYAYRDISGSKVYDSIRDDNYGESFGEGDVIGCSIRLDDFDYSNNQIRFFKNGKDQGIAYQEDEIPTGIYFPAISLYMKARVRINFGPSFIIKPDLQGYMPVSEVQPMSLDDRKIHEQRIAKIREDRFKFYQANISTESRSIVASTTGDDEM